MKTKTITTKFYLINYQRKEVLKRLDFNEVEKKLLTNLFKKEGREVTLSIVSSKWYQFNTKTKYYITMSVGGDNKQPVKVSKKLYEYVDMCLNMSSYKELLEFHNV